MKAIAMHASFHQMSLPGIFGAGDLAHGCVRCQGRVYKKVTLKVTQRSLQVVHATFYIVQYQYREYKFSMAEWRT